MPVLSSLREKLLNRLRPRSVPAAPPQEPPAHPHFSEQELLARTDEFNRAAEDHWKHDLGDATARHEALNKPFTTVQDAASILYRLGLLLSELRPGVGHTVLDLGAGSCWLSAYLNRLRCRTISVDVSPSALELGREMFHLDPRQRLELEPRFLIYDGHHIPLPADSVDRVACFDAFHHVPNQDEILSEIHRVLKPGGRAVFAEPGEDHSHAALSIYEMSRRGVLENDVDLEALAEKARHAGFTGIRIKPYPDQAALGLDATTFFRFLHGDDSVFPLAEVRANLRTFSLFTLLKGQEILDSRSPGILKADIRLTDPAVPIQGKAGAAVSLRVAVTNNGDTLWRHEVEGIGGYVSLGGHLVGEDGHTLMLGYFRTALPCSVAAGETVEVLASFVLPGELGRYALRLDMVDEYIMWFQQTGSPVAELTLLVDGYPDTREPQRLAARLEIGESAPPLRVQRGRMVRFPVRATNVGNTVWLDSVPAGDVGAVALGSHLVGADGSLIVVDLCRIPLPRPVAPGEAVDLECRFRAPLETGAYRVRLDLVIEGRLWFEHCGSVPEELALDVEQAPLDSVAPGLLRAAIVWREPAPRLTAHPGSALRLAVGITNDGDTLWLHAASPEGGQVALGGRLLTEAGDLVQQDLFRTVLPRDIAPGESVELHAQLSAPREAGQYLIELDMVDEGIVWFGAVGSPTMRIALDCR